MATRGVGRAGREPTAGGSRSTAARDAGELELGRGWDFLFGLGIVFLVTAAAHVNNMLTVGDWDFWTDWKDRQWWPLVTPALTMVPAAIVHYIAWSQLRLPIGATLVVVSLVVAQWLSRTLSFMAWAYLPLNFVPPATMVPMGVVLDVLLLWTRSYVLTSLLGGLAWGLLFQPLNAPLVAPFWQPVVYHGHLLSLADVQGFEYLRTQTPSYLRIVEQGHFRAFLQQVQIVVAFFAGMVSMGTYWVGYAIGKWLGVRSASRFFPGWGERGRPGGTPVEPAAADGRGERGVDSGATP